MSRIRAVFWDIGGVLLTNGWDHKERALLYERFGIDKGPVEERHEGPNDLWEKGKITVWEYLDRVIFFEPRDFTPQQFFEAMKEVSQVLNPGCFDILRGLAGQKDCKLVMVNNESAELNDYRIETFGLAKLFDFFVCSAYVGLRKPSREMFETALRLTQIPPQEVAFIDDRAGNCESAASLGINAIHFKSPEQFGQRLRELGVSFAMETVNA
jgi:putative hydrolase of the HAD superfamily